MAPEQIEGQEADARTDIFAFGAVLHEMLTGRKAFTGKTHASLISSILKDEPRPVLELQPLMPPLLDHIVSRCLAKDPDERWQCASDLTRELRWIYESGATDREAASPLARGVRRSHLILAVAAASLAGVSVGVAATMLGWLGGRFAQQPPVTRVLVNVAPAEYLQATRADRTTVEGRPSRTAMAWSPDGRSIAFTAVKGDRQQLYVRALDQPVATALPGTEGAANPFFSPDGHWLGFWSAGTLKKIAVDGSGPAMAICEIPIMFGASWGSDDTIIFARNFEGLWRVSASGGTPEALIKPDAEKGEVRLVLPQVLPGHRAVLFTATHTPLPRWDDTEVVVQSLATGERKVLIKAGADGRYVSSGHLLFVRQGTLMAVPFDLQRLEVTGGAVALIADVMQSANTPNETSESGAGQFSVSESGSLLYAPGGMFPDPERSVVWVDRTGAVQTLPLPARAYAAPRLSPDGQRMAVWTQGDRNVWIFDLVSWNVDAPDVRGAGMRELSGRRTAHGSRTDPPRRALRTSSGSRRTAAAPRNGLPRATYQECFAIMVGRRSNAPVHGEPSRYAIRHLDPFPRGGRTQSAPLLADPFQRIIPGVLAGRTLVGVCVGRVRSQRSVRAALSRSRTAAASVDRWWHRSGLVPRRAGNLLSRPHYRPADRRTSPR